MTYDPIDTNDDGVVDADVDNQSVNTGKAVINPSTVIVANDIHYGQDNNVFVSQSEKESKIDSILSEAGSRTDTAVDDVHIIWNGDIIHEDPGNQSSSEQRIADFRNYVEGNTPQGVQNHYLMGNHEHVLIGGSSTWGLDDWGYSSLSETYFSIDLTHCKLICLNTGYNDTSKDNLDSGVPPNQYAWLKDELEATDKPVAVFTHTPIFPAISVDQYDIIDPAEAWKYSALLADYDNILGVWFGHVHHAVHDKPHPEYNHSHSESFLGVRHFYQHFIHSLGGVNLANGNGDTSKTPFGILSVRQDAHATFEQSYSGTDFRESFEVSGEPAPMDNVGSDFSAFVDEQSFGDLLNSDVWVLQSDASNSGNFAIEDSFSASGVPSTAITLSTDATSGSVSQARFYKFPPYRAAMRYSGAWNGHKILDWPDVVWKATVRIPDRSAVDAYIGMGAISPSDGDSDGFFEAVGDHTGVYIQGSNNTISGSVGNGSNQSTVFVEDLATDPFTIMIRRKWHPNRQTKFAVNHGSGQWKSIASNNPPETNSGGAPNQFVNWWIRADEATSKSIQLLDWDVRAEPILSHGDAGE